MIKSGEVNVGDEIACPDGWGKVVQVFDPDNVMIRLDGGILAAWDVERCAKKNDPSAEKVLV